MRWIVALVGITLCFSAPSTVTADVDQYTTGEEAFERADYAKALELWSEALSGGEPKASFGAGRLLMALGGKAELEKGVGLVRKSARAGYLPAQELLGNYKLHGMYMSQDLEGCLGLYVKISRKSTAEKRRHPYEAARAILTLHSFYRFDIGPVRRDLRRMASLLRESADMGNAAAQYYLGLALVNGSKEIPRDLAEAHKYFVLSWKQNGGIYRAGSLERPKQWISARGPALRLRKKLLSKDAFERSRVRIRKWLAAKDAGTLGWAFDPEKTRSKGEIQLKEIEEMHLDIGAGMSSMDLETQMPCVPMSSSAKRKCTQGYVHHRSRWKAPKAPRRFENWTYASGNTVRVYPVRYDETQDGNLSWRILSPRP